MPALMRCLGYDEKHIGKTALCPFHSDEHPSFSVFQSKSGKGWQWKCFLDRAKTGDYYEAKFLSEFSKVRFATGDGTLMAALENVAKLSPDQLPEIPGKLNAPESWRRLAALHRELSRLRDKPTHFLAYRDAARVFDGMSHQEAHAITGALETLGVIKIVSKGKAGLNSREAAEFRCLLSQSENGETEIPA
jgi:hypothetical protein